MFININMALWRLGGCLVVSFLVLSCGLRVGERAPENSLNSGDRFSCLSQMDEILDQYIDGKLSDQRILTFTECVQGAFKRFAKTRGQDRGSYHPEEIRAFLEHHFLENRKISDELLSEFMNLKTVVVGGAGDRILRSDLQAAVDLIGFLGQQLVKLNPYMDIYNFGSLRFATVSLDRPQAEKRLNRALRTLKEVAGAIGEKLASSNSSYKLENLERVLTELRGFLEWEKRYPKSHRPETWVNLLKSFREVAVGQNSVVRENGKDMAVIRPQHWRELLENVAGWYGLMLRFRKAGDEPSLLKGEGLQSLLELNDELTQGVHFAIDRQKNKLITYAQIDQLIDSLEPFGWLPRVAAASGENRIIPAAVLKSTLRPLFDKMFGDGRVASHRRNSGGLSRSVWAQIQSEFSQWAEIQKHLDRKFNVPRGRGGLATQSLENDLVAREFSVRDLTPQVSGATVETVVEFLMSSLQPMYAEGSMRVHIANASDQRLLNIEHGFRDLSMVNAMRVLIMLIGRGYASPEVRPSLFEGGVTEDQLQQWYLDFRDLGVALQLMDPRSSGAGRRTFKEANIFTMSGNGLFEMDEVERKEDALLTAIEGIEELALLNSAGELGRNLFSALMNSDSGLCGRASEQAPVSVHGYKMIDRGCFGREFYRVLDPLLGPMPGMQRELRSLPAPAREQMIKGLIAMTYSPEWSEEKWVEWNDITTISVILQYMETIMVRYDKDHDSKLSSEEVWSAFSTFKGYLSQMVVGQCREALSKEKSFKLNFLAWVNADRTPPEIDFAYHLRDVGCSRGIAQRLAPGVFAFLIDRGRPPAGLSDLFDAVKLTVRKPDLALDRVRLVNVFSALVAAQQKNAK